MNRITRRRSPKWGSSKGKPNPFENRGLEKFQEVYSELERMRSSIAEQEGVSTSDVWFTRGTSSSRDWIPVVVGKSSRSSSACPRLDKKSSIPHWEADSDQDTSCAAAEDLQTAFVSGESQRQGVSGSSSSWLSVKSEQIVYDMQQGGRKALKAITLFIMVAAAVLDVLVAVVAGLASSWIARHLRPLWARYLPLGFSRQLHNKDLSFAFPLALSSLNTPPPPSSYSCLSAPTSPQYHHQSPVESPPRQQQQQQQQQQQSLRGAKMKPGGCLSTPVSPVRGGSGTYFSSDRPGLSSSRSSSPTRFQRFEMVQQRKQEESEEEGGSGMTPVMCIVLVILVGLSFGRLTAAVMATGAWFLFPVVERLGPGQGFGLRPPRRGSR